MDRTRRQRRIAIALAVVLALALTVWLLLPRIACGIANASLPRDLGPGATLLALSPGRPSSTPPPILLELDPALMRRIAAEASRRWVPPGVIRHGLTAVGAVHGAGGRSVPWQVVAVDGVVPPRLSISLSPEEADALIATAASLPTIAGLAISPRLSSVELAALPDDGADRRFRVEASGALRLAGGSLRLELPVRRIVARVSAAFRPAEGGWEPIIGVSIDELDAPLPPIPGIDAATWRRLLGEWAQSAIAAGLANRTVPPWFPLDLQVSAVVR
jgi:hypothetical protein